MKKLRDLALESLINIQGSYGIMDLCLWMSAVPLTWPSKSKSAQKRKLLLATVLHSSFLEGQTYESHCILKYVIFLICLIRSFLTT